MGNLIDCACKKKNLLDNGSSGTDSSEEEEENDSDNENIQQSYFKTRLDQVLPKNLVDYKIRTNSLVKKHNSNPWDYYEEVEEIGVGAFGTVKKVRLIDDPEIIRAMKIIPKSNITQRKHLLDEIDILRQLEHPNIMKIFEYFDDKVNIYIVSELYDQGDLLEIMEKLGTMNQLVVKYIMDQIFSAVSYLHSNNIFHGDIKLENIMLYKTTSKNIKRFTRINRDLNKNKQLEEDVANSLKNKNKKKYRSSIVYVEDIADYEVKLIDFGCSKYKKKKQKLKGIIGTSIYCSPEVIDNCYDEMCDEWSCGVLMYILLTGEPPFTGKNEEEIFENVKKGNIDFSLKQFNYVSENCIDLIKQLLEKSKKKRIKASEALKHPFFNEDFDPNEALLLNADLNMLNELLNIKKFRSKLHEVVTAYLCFNFINKEEEKKLSKLFRYIDKDNKTKFDIYDLKLAFRNASIYVSTKQLKNIMNVLDSDGNSTIEYQEFLRAMCDKKQLFCEKNLRNVFNYMDKDKKGFINEKDIMRFVFGNKNYHRESIFDIMAQIGLEKNSQLNFEEFEELIKNNNKLNQIKDEEKSMDDFDMGKNRLFMNDLNANANDVHGRRGTNIYFAKNDDFMRGSAILKMKKFNEI